MTDFIIPSKVREIPGHAAAGPVIVLTTENNQVLLDPAAAPGRFLRLVPGQLEDDLTLLAAGKWREETVAALELPLAEAVQRFPAATPCDIRVAFTLLSEAESLALCRARELLFWARRNHFCGRCGSQLIFSEDMAKICPQCRERFYPQIAPAVIVAVTQEDRLLLAHNRNFPGSVHSLIAGFVEAGETLEQAVEREIWEETRLQVKNVRYLSSQSWPFPSTLMLGFAAEYASGTLELDGDELDHADWFSRASEPPRLPKDGSISRRIIDDFYFQRGVWAAK